jgi:hypothetical protein
MWWLSFLGGGIVILEASSLSHARMLAALNKLGRVSRFAEGHSISPEGAALIPNDSIGRLLSAREARDLRDLVEHGQRKYLADPSRERGIMPSRRRV